MCDSANLTVMMVCMLCLQGEQLPSVPGAHAEPQRLQEGNHAALLAIAVISIDLSFVMVILSQQS